MLEMLLLYQLVYSISDEELHVVYNDQRYHAINYCYFVVFKFDIVLIFLDYLNKPFYKLLVCYQMRN